MNLCEDFERTDLKRSKVSNIVTDYTRQSLGFRVHLSFDDVRGLLNLLSKKIWSRENDKFSEYVRFFGMLETQFLVKMLLKLAIPNFGLFTWKLDESSVTIEKFESFQLKDSLAVPQHFLGIRRMIEHAFNRITSPFDSTAYGTPFQSS